MSKTPPLLPSAVLRRVLRLARFDGASVLGIAGISALGSALLGDFTGAIVCVIIAGAGVFELHGVALLNGGWERGMRWLVGSQLYLLASILAYVVWKMSGDSVETWIRLAGEALKTQEGQLQLEATGSTPDEMLAAARSMYYVSFMLVGVVTFFYQGAMAVYYYRRRKAVAIALGEIFSDE